MTTQLNSAWFGMASQVLVVVDHVRLTRIVGLTINQAARRSGYRPKRLEQLEQAECRITCRDVIALATSYGISSAIILDRLESIEVADDDSNRCTTGITQVG